MGFNLELMDAMMEITITMMVVTKIATFNKAGTVAMEAQLHATFATLWKDHSLSMVLYQVITM